MAADGSLNFDTGVNTEGFDAGMSTLTKAVEKLTSIVETLTNKMEGGFSDGRAAASSAAEGIDQISDSAKAAAAELERLQKEKDAVFTGTITNNNAPPPPTMPNDGRQYNIYGTDVDTAIAKNRELEAAAQQTAAAIERESENEQRSMVSLKDSLLNALGVFKRLPGGIANIFQKTVSAMTGTEAKFHSLQDEIDRYTDALYYAEQKGYGLGDKPYDDAYIGLAKAKQAAEKYKKSLLGVDNTQKKADKSARKMTGSLKSMKKTTVPLTKSILKLSSMLKLMLIRMAMRAVIQAAKEGFQNLVQYSGETNKSVSMLVSAITRLKNSFATAFAPLVNAAAPALKGLIDLLSEGATMAAQFLAALTGKSTIVKAVDVEEDYGASLKKNNKELKEREKENKKLAFSFDDLIQAQKKAKKSDYIGPTPDQMFETATVENDIKSFADKVKGIFSDLFKPLKQSWMDNGGYVTSAVKAAFASIKNLASDVGKSFMQVWDKEGYGKKITDDLLISFGNLILTVKNLADRFDEAWKNGDMGTNILRHLGDIILVLTGFLREATEAIRDWAGKLDFSPLLKSFDGILIKIEPIVQKIGDALLWLLKNVLLPLAKWGIECGLPAVFRLIAAALGALNSVLGALQPLAMWLWNSFLQPLGKWTGEVIIAALKGLTKWLDKFSGWISQHRSAVENITIVIAAFFAAWKVATFITGIVMMVAKIRLLNQILGLFGIDLMKVISKIALAGLKFGALTVAIAGIVSVIAILARNWSSMSPTQKVISGILAAASAVAVLAVALGAVKGAAGALLVAGALAAGITAATIAVSAGNHQSGASGASSGYSPRDMGGASYRMPHLATGTVVPPRAGEFAAILGDNNREAEVVSPISAMKQAFKEAIQEMGGLGGNNQAVKADLILDSTRFGQLVFQYANKEKQRIGVRMVTEG